MKRNLTVEEIVEYKTDLLAFVKYMFASRKNIEFIENWHHKAICDALEKVFIGKTKRLIINIPPRYSKTEISVVNFIPWALGNFPDSEFIHASYSHRLAANNAWQAREMVQHEAYSAVFGDVDLKSDSKAKDEWRTEFGGVVYAAGSSGTITGYGAGKNRPGFGGCIIIDDPHKADEATSDVMRENVIEWYKNTIDSRLNTKDTPIIVIMQRLHDSDLAGWLLAGGTGEKWEHVCIPAIDSKGKALWPLKHTIEDLERKQRVDEYNFAGQYMQTPSPLGGGIFKKKYWRWWPDDKPLPVLEHVFLSFDTAYSEKDFKNNACSAYLELGVFWNEQEQRHCLILTDTWHDRVAYPELREKAHRINKEREPDAFLIEKKASGISLVQDLRMSGINVRTYQPDRDKVSRAYAITAMIQSGQVYLPNRKWAHRFVNFLALFPNGNAPSADYADCLTQGCLYLRNGWWVTHPDDDAYNKDFETEYEEEKRVAAYG